ncbi:MAG TPA: hypothetical protein PKY82_06470 [Pyrinomonadaceae bacterium]|nr:hypothetical protein [Pyrinomonadaceae bacterium]
MKTFGLTVVFIFFVLSGNGLCFQAVTVNLKNLQSAFIAKFDKDFQFIKGEVKNHQEEKELQKYWLAQVKPKNTGYFTIKYAYHFADKFYASGETEMNIAVSGKGCRRYPQIIRDIGHFCLGDTIVIPIRLQNFSKHTFSLKSKYETPENIEELRKPYSDFYSKELDTEKIINPLDPNLKYLGKYRRDDLRRSGGGTFRHFAVFEAVSLGKFNLGLSAQGNDSNNKKEKVLSVSTPIIIINPGTPITALVPEERSTYYIKDRTYSSDYNKSFESNLLILQPGDVISIPFYFFFAKAWWEEKGILSESQARTINPTPIIYKQPFLIKTDEGFNDWVNDYLAN